MDFGFQISDTGGRTSFAAKRGLKSEIRNLKSVTGARYG